MLRVPRRISHVAVGLLLVTVAVGCAPDSAPQPQRAPAVATRGGVFRVVQNEPAGLDPARVDDSYAAAVVNQIYDGLLQHDTNFSVRPNVARSWQIAEDGLTYRFTLERGVTFQDGSLVTVQDVAFSIERVFRLDPASTTLARAYLGVISGAEAFARGETESIVGMRILGEDEIEFRLDKPYAPFLNVLASEFARIVPRAYVLAHGDDVLLREPIGCGPFALARWEPGRKLVLQRFEGYHATPAYVDSLEILTPPPPVLKVALDGFLRGEVHAVELTSGGRDALAAVHGAEIHRRRELSLTYLGLNAAVPPFGDARVRQAFAHAIDVDGLEHLDSPSRAPATGVLPPGFPGFSPEPKRLPHDHERAMALLAEAGHPDGKGLPTVIVAVPRRSAFGEPLVDDLCAQFAAIGVDARPQYFDWDDFDRGLNENSFGAFLITWVADLPDPDSFFYPLLHSAGSMNYFHHASAEVDAALETARSENDRGRRIELYRDIERSALSEAILIPVHFSSTIFAVRPDVRDFEVSSMGGGDLPLHQVWFQKNGREPMAAAR